MSPLSNDPAARAQQLANLHRPQKRDIPRAVAGLCADCAGPCREGATRCRECWRRSGDRSGGRRPVWTRETILEALRAWAAANGGEAPRLVDIPYSPLPTVETVKKWFPKWGDAVEAAGLRRRAKGEQIRDTPGGQRMYGRNRQMVTAGADGPGARAGQANVREVVRVRSRRSGQPT